jgi:hypothetical protein
MRISAHLAGFDALPSSGIRARRGLPRTLRRSAPGGRPRPWVRCINVPVARPRRGVRCGICIERALVVDHVAWFGASCIEEALVVDHVPGFDASTPPLLAHVGEFDAESASRGPRWSTTSLGSMRLKLLVLEVLGVGAELHRNRLCRAGVDAQAAVRAFGDVL